MIEKQIKVGGYKTVPLIVPEPYERKLMHTIAEEGTRIYSQIINQKRQPIKTVDVSLNLLHHNK